MSFARQHLPLLHFTLLTWSKHLPHCLTVRVISPFVIQHVQVEGRFHQIGHGTLILIHILCSHPRRPGLRCRRGITRHFLYGLPLRESSDWMSALYKHPLNGSRKPSHSA